jgi:Bacterial PH domain
MKPDCGANVAIAGRRARRESARFIRSRELHRPMALPARADFPPVHAAESAAIAAASGTRVSPLAALLSGQVLRDGELVLLVLNPSLWFILFQSIRFAAAVVLVLLCARVLGDRHQFVHGIAYFETGAFLIGGRLMFAVVQWMRRLYVLTDRRVIRLAGVFSVDVFECPLRKVAQTRVTTSFKERICRVGSIEIQPCEPPGGSEETLAAIVWQTVPRPIEVNERLAAAIRRAKNGIT